jgi:hypothetical protein
MLLRYERNRDAESRRLSGLEIVGYRCGPWREYGGEGKYLCTDRRWERIGEVRKRTDVPLQCASLDRGIRRLDLYIHREGHRPRTCCYNIFDR